MMIGWLHAASLSGHRREVPSELPGEKPRRLHSTISAADGSGLISASPGLSGVKAGPRQRPARGFPLGRQAHPVLWG